MAARWQSSLSAARSGPSVRAQRSELRRRADVERRGFLRHARASLIGLRAAPLLIAENLSDMPLGYPTLDLRLNLCPSALFGRPFKGALQRRGTVLQRGQIHSPWCSQDRAAS